MIIVPLTNQPNQSLTVNIPRDTGNLPLQLFLYWNRIAGYWQLSVTDLRINTEVITNLPLITGDIPYPNLLAQFEYLDLGKAYIVALSNKTPNYPGETDWGTNFTLFWE